MKTIQVRRTRHAGYCWRGRDEFISDVILRTPHMARQKQDDQLEHPYSSYVRIRDVALNTSQRRWTVGRSGEKGSGISVPVAWHIYIYIYICVCVCVCVCVGCVLWHINACRLFNTKSCLYIYINIRILNIQIVCNILLWVIDHWFEHS